MADANGELVPVRLGVWQVKVGRVSLYLLDTKVEGNPDWARDVTDTLYGGDRENRLRQELVLGVGGVRVLRRLGLEPTVFHMNEGHSAFLQLERLRELVEEEGLDTTAALERLRGSTVFTTHTPVPAGNEVFDPGLVERNVGHLVERCGLSWNEFADLGKLEPDDTVFGLTPFALRTAAWANGVSELHGAVSREMWHALWPDRPVDQVPITSITNGVHARTWISDELEDLLGHASPDFTRALELPDEVLWSAHRAAKERMLEFIARTRGATRLDPDVITIGFARRFATYKRAGPAVRPAGAAAAPARRSGSSGADPPRGEGSSRRRGGKGRDPARRRARPRPRGRQPRRLPSGLRDDARAPARPGGRRLAQHPAAADGGVRHIRDEGGAERRAELLDPRRVVGRGLRAVASDSRSATATSSRRTRNRMRPTRSRSTASSRSRCCPRTTNATRTASRRAGSR